MTTSQYVRGQTIRYDDRRPKHNVTAEILSVDPNGMTVQFEDRADTTYIGFKEAAWMEFISLEK